MKRRIEKVVVLGAGTMGARIAAHFANAGVPVLLLDIVPPGLTSGSAAERNKIVRAGLDAAKKSKPAAFFTAALADKISIGNFDDDLQRIKDADWIIEVVAENLEIKKNLLARVAQFRKPGSIVTTNTSGLPVHLIAEGMSDEFQQHWAGTHFFNPPRYLKLVEIIPGPKTLPEVLETLAEFCDRRLGKGVVVAKDTPNFIANRIGTFSMLNALRLMNKLGMTIEEVDACTGPAIGQPKSATFRTADLVGLDVLMHVVKNIYETATDDESREMYKVPAFVEDMAKRKWLGDKTGQGFYKKLRGEGEKEILTLDVNTMEYRPRQKARFASIEAGKTIEDTRDRLRALIGPVLQGQTGDKAQQFLWSSISETCLYAARRVPEISDRVEDVDRAVRWGFVWELGPFQIMDTLGVDAFAAQIKKEGRTLPPAIEKLLASGRNEFLYLGKRYYFSIRLKWSRHQKNRRAGRRHLSQFAEGRRKRSGAQLRRQLDRSWRWRVVLRISFQDERHRRGFNFHDSQGTQAARNRFRRYGHRQSGAEFFRGRKPDARADGRAGTGMGRAAPRRQTISECELGH